MVYVAPERPNVVGDVLTLARQQVLSRVMYQGARLNSYTSNAYE